MQSPVFVVATANDVTQLPPEMLRKGRWDELFFVDLPNAKEREMIWNIQIQKHGRDPRDFDLVQLARATDGLTGSEIESVFVVTAGRSNVKRSPQSPCFIGRVPVFRFKPNWDLYLHPRTPPSL